MSDEGDSSSDNDISVGGKKSNGHKMDCKCPICKNMMKKKGGQPDPKDESDSDSDSKEKPKDTNIDDAKTKGEVDASKKEDSDSMDSDSMDSNGEATPTHTRPNEANIPSERGGRRRTKKVRKSRKSKKSKKSRKSRKTRKSRKSKKSKK